MQERASVASQPIGLADERQRQREKQTRRALQSREGRCKAEQKRERLKSVSGGSWAVEEEALL